MPQLPAAARPRARAHLGSGGRLLLGPWLTFLALFAAGGPAPGQGAPEVDARGRLILQTAELADALKPRARRSGDRLRLDGSVAETGHAVFANCVAKPSLELKVVIAGSGRFLITLGADPDRSRGLSVVVDPVAGEVSLSRWADRAFDAGSNSSPETIGDERVALRLAIRRGAVEARLDGEPVPVTGERRFRRHWSEGRVLLGAEGLGVWISNVELEIEPTRQARRRWGELAKDAPLDLPRQRRIGWAGPLDRLRWDRGLESPGQRGAAEDIRDARHSGRSGLALERARKFRRDHPDKALGWFVEGVLELAGGARVPAAARALSRVRELDPEWPGAALLEGDALYLLGRLDAAQACYEAAPEGKERASALALLAWSRGETAAATEWLERAEGVRDRRSGLRLRWVDEGALVASGESGLEGVSARGIEVWSDLDARAARRVLELVTPFLGPAQAELGLAGDTAPLRILALSRKGRFDLWNARLGGVRFGDTDGVYRGGLRLLVIRDDPDEEVLRRRLQHELVHHLVHCAGLALPALFEEGLADWLSTAHPRGGRLVGLGKPAWGRFRTAWDLAARDRLRSPVQVLLSAPALAGARGRADYAEAWAAVHTLAADSPAAGRGPLGALLNRGTESLDLDAWGPALERRVSREKIARHLRGLRPE